MKKIVLVIIFILVIPSMAVAMKATTAKDAIACFTKESLQEMQQFSINKDNASFDAYIKTGKCIVMREGLDVTVIESPGMFGGITMFIFNGVKLWTLRHGLTNYRAQ